MNIYEGIEDLIGHTPLARLYRIEQEYGLDAALLAKLESFNPAGSAKDRVAARIIAEAERDGRLPSGGTIIEPTSGNTGIGLAAVGGARGYRVILTMPETMSAERQSLIRAYGAEIVLTPGSEGMAGAVKKAEELQKATPGSILGGQFDNPANPAAHYDTTGPEIWADTDGQRSWAVSQGEKSPRGGGCRGAVCFAAAEPWDCRPPRTSGHRREFRAEKSGPGGAGRNYSRL